MVGRFAGGVSVAAKVVVVSYLLLVPLAPVATHVQLNGELIHAASATLLKLPVGATLLAAKLPPV